MTHIGCCLPQLTSQPLHVAHKKNITTHCKKYFTPGNAKDSWDTVPLTCSQLPLPCKIEKDMQGGISGAKSAHTL
jgi:hypothetical protein